MLQSRDFGGRCSKYLRTSVLLMREVIASKCCRLPQHSYCGGELKSRWRGKFLPSKSDLTRLRLSLAVLEFQPSEFLVRQRERLLTEKGIRGTCIAISIMLLFSAACATPGLCYKA